MNNFIIYSIETAICLALFYLAYRVFLKNDTFFKLNRFYLLASVVASLLMPLLNISMANNTGQNSFVTKYLIVPVEQYEQDLSENMYNGHFHGPHGPMPHHNSQLTGTKLTANKTDDAQSVSVNASATKPNWLNIILAVYFIGLALFLLRFLLNFIRILVYVSKHPAQKISGMKVIRLEKNISPFSFLNFIFINRNDYPAEELAKIIAHEKVHILQKHSIDLILLELLLIFQWFNPFVWLYKRSLKITHEYLADLGTLNSGVELSGYQYSLLNQVMLENNFEIASTYTFSVKKRIAMMMKKRSSKLSTLKVIVALPVFLFLFSAFAFNCNSSNANNTQTILKGDKDSIKKIAVPIEYLRSLEGEYISTNEPNHVRKIIFTELLGNLYGWDNGYSYKIIPVGEGKFINPDDRASLVFSTDPNNYRDKKAVSLLLFGKINLNKVVIPAGTPDVQNRSLALTVAKVMLKDGIDAGLAYYKATKDSTNYYGSEGEANIVGYDLLNAGKTKEAAAYLKLNTEINPASFNAFDSYADALLALGDKAKAIEASKEAVKLNPGCKTSLKRLKDLGVNTDDMVKTEKAPLKELQLLEGTYLSTNDHNWIRKIVFKIKDGVLWGEDNGYNYQLISMGNGKFINPDDGASLVFDTKNKNAINLLLFGTLRLNKIKESAAPTLNLKEYAGIYVPAKQDTMLRPMEIITNGTKLFRYIKEAPEIANRTIDMQFITENLFYYTDNSRRSIEFVVNDKKQVTGCILRRWDGVYNLAKK